jgi:hypothetical protein
MEIFDINKLMEYINNWPVEFVDYGPLHQPATKLSLERASLQYKIKVGSNGNSRSVDHNYPVGTVRSLENEIVRLKNEVCESIIISEVECNGHSVSGLQERIKEQICFIESVDVYLKGRRDGRYIIDWFENVCDGSYLWPNIMRCERMADGSGLIDIGDGQDSLKIRVGSSGVIFSQSVCCMELHIAGTKCFLIHFREEYNYKGIKSGCILYDGVLDIEVRAKIYNSLSFLLGRPLLSVGYAIFDLDWNLSSFQLRSPNTFNDAVFRLVSISPMPICSQFGKLLDGVMISNYVDRIIDGYDKYFLRSLFWRYWHAVCAPIHARAVQLGACIEAIQSVYLEIHDEKINSRIIDKKLYNENLKIYLLEVISKAKMSSDENTFFTRAIENLNKVPQRVITARFFKNLDLMLSELEQKAWDQRNDSAHGKIKAKTDSIGTIRENKILKNILHRMLIRILNLGSTYIDIYSLNHPVRSVSVPCDK